MTYEPSYLVRLLRTARETLKLSRQALADEIGYTPSYVEKIERGEEPVCRDYLKRAAPGLAAGVDVPELLAWVRGDGLRRPVVSEWLRPYLEIEKQADVIRWFEPLLIPGLLQAPEYARALLDTEEQVTARMARQELFERDEPAEVVAIIDESVLRPSRRAGGWRTSSATSPRYRPSSRCSRPRPTSTPGLNGSFLLTSVGGRGYVYVGTPARGFTLDDPELVSKVRHDWDVLRGEALRPRQSREVILRAAEEWKKQSS